MTLRQADGEQRDAGQSEPAARVSTCIRWKARSDQNGSFGRAGVRVRDPPLATAMKPS